MNSRQIRDIIVEFIKNKVKEEGFNKVVVGMSGGVDSSVVAKLAVESLGKNNVIGLLMPKNIIHDLDQDSENLAKSLHVTYYIISVYDIIDVNYFYHINAQSGHGDISNYRQGNIISRARMLLLHDIAMKDDALVIGTLDKTKFMLGSFTKCGVSGADFEPIIDLYKTEVLKLARFLELPDEIINKPQSYEKILGITHTDADKILWWLIEESYDPIKFVENMPNLTGIKDRKLLDRILSLISLNRHKRYLPEFLKIGNLDARRIRFNV